MNTQPKVSVVIPAYNVCAYLEEALKSLERQSFQAFEAIVVDDGSTDGTVNLVQQFCQRDSRFRLFTKPNGGLSSARNYGIRQAQAGYIAMLDGDDRYEPDKLANHVQCLDRDPRVGVVYSASKIIRHDGQLSWMSLDGKPIQSNPLVSLLCKNFVGHGSNAVFRRILINEVGEFDELRQRVDGTSTGNRERFAAIEYVLLGYLSTLPKCSDRMSKLFNQPITVLENSLNRGSRLLMLICIAFLLA
jgi:glycosyltransferase involved in cell wall biosynthesis